MAADLRRVTAMRLGAGGGLAVFVVPATCFMAVAFLAPLLMVIATSFGGGAFTLSHYAELASRPLYINVLCPRSQQSCWPIPSPTISRASRRAAARSC
jgi:hypothetical protein